MGWKNIVKKDFSIQKKLDLSHFFEGLGEIWITLKKLSAIKKKEVFSAGGIKQISENYVDENGKTKTKVIQEFTDEYEKSYRDRWRLFFDYVIDKENHGMASVLEETGNKKLDLKFWEDVSENLPAMFEYVEKEIIKFVNETGEDEDPKSKKK